MERLPNLAWLKDDLILDGIFNWVNTILKITVTQLFNISNIDFTVKKIILMPNIYINI
jgi:hypothetical protein